MRFLEDRVRKIEALLKNAVFAISTFRDTATLPEKTDILDSFQDELGFYNSIIFFDLNGDPTF